MLIIHTLVYAENKQEKKKKNLILIIEYQILKSLLIENLQFPR